MRNKFEIFNERLCNIERVLRNLNYYPENLKKGVESEQWLNLTDLCNYLPGKPKKVTVYKWVRKRLIPFHKSPGQKKLRFSKSEIDNWLKTDQL